MRFLADPGVRLVGAGLAAIAGAAAQLQQPALWSAAVYVTGACAGLLGLAASGVAGLMAAPFIESAARPASTQADARSAPPAELPSGSPAPAPAPAPTLAGPPVAATGRRGSRSAAATLALWALLVLLGFAATGWRATHRLADTLAPALEGRDLELTGAIAQMPRPGPTGTRFVFAVEQALQDGAPVRVPSRLSLGWYRAAEAEALLAGPGVELRAGQRWRFMARLKAPHGSRNPNGFDVELWLFEQGIGASGSVRVVAGAPAQRLADADGYTVEKLRQRLRDAIHAQVPDSGAAGVLAALAIGDQPAIERADWELFRATGVAHLMAISGLHVTMFAWLAGALVGSLWRLSPRLMLRLPAPQTARWGGLVCAAAYALLAGWGVPAQRTVWMIAAVVLLRSLTLRWPAPVVLLAAGVVVVVVDPWALLQPGFWLSFVAVGLLMVAAPAAPAPADAGRRDRLWAALRGGLRTQAVATVGLAPLTLLFFQQLSLVGFVANLFAIPLVAAVITPLALLGALVPPLWTMGAAAVQGMTGALLWLAGAPLAVWSAASAPAWAAAAGLLGGLLLVLALPWRLRLLGLPLLLPLLWPALPRPPEGRFEAVAVDIGQGTAVLVRTRGHLLVYDTGPAYGSQTDAGERVLLPLLRSRGERRIDLLLLSHRDSDHVGGAASLLARLPVLAMMSSLEDGHPLRAGTVPHERCAAGRAWTWDGVRFELLHPAVEDYGRALKPNALSCVLRVQGDAASLLPSLLLTGDIEAAQEAALVAGPRAPLASDVLLVPHHGSRTSSSGAFLDAVAPSVAVVQAGYRSRYGHPAPDVLARYAARGITVVRSDACGAWTLDAGGGTLCERDRDRRYWHHRTP